MRNFALLAAGALLMIVVQADAMTFSNTASVRDASVDTVKPEQVRWCRMRNCRPRYYEPLPYYWGSGWYLYCGPVLRHPAELLPAADLGGRVWLGGRSCKGWPAAPAFGG